MEWLQLSDSVKIKKISETQKEGVFEIEGLYTGYGLTIGNALRRVLLSSLTGAAITSIKIKGAEHEFSTIPGVLEDAIEITLNLKRIRFKFYADEPQVLTLKVKGERKATAGDIKGNAQTEVVNKDSHIATLTSKNAELDMEITVEKGAGYVPVEARKIEKLPIKTIAIDAFFSPVVRVNFDIENMRVGERTDFNRLKLVIETDGTISPSRALHKSCNILKDHFEKIGEVEITEEEKKLEEAAEVKEIVKEIKEKKGKKEKKSKKKA